MSKHVLVATGGPEPNVRLARFISYLDKRCVSSSIAVWRREYNESVPSTWRGHPNSCIHSGGGYRSIKIAPHIILYAFRLSSFIRRTTPKNVIAYDFESALGAMLAHKHQPFEFVYDIGDNFHLRHSYNSIPRSVILRYEHTILKRANLIMVPDSSRITSVEEPYSDKIVVIHNCPPLIPDRNKHFRQDGSIHLFWNGLLVTERGWDVISAALDRMDNAIMFIAGEGDRRVIKEAENHPKVRYLGPIDYAQCLDTYWETDAVVTFYRPDTPIHRCAMSNKWYDAMATRNRIILNNEITAATWLTEQGVADSMRYGDIDGFVSIVSSLQNQPGLLERGFDRGRRLHETVFNWEHMESILDRLFLPRLR